MTTHRLTSNRRYFAFAMLIAGAAAPLVTTPASATETTLKGAAYIQQCEDAGVPTPPAWNFSEHYGDENSEWQFSGVIENEFVAEPLTAHAFYYESSDPPGACMILPRLNGPPENPATMSSLLAMICQGTETSKACFYEAENVLVGTTLQPEQFPSGADLLGHDPCTDCHKGDNVFVIHPETALAIGFEALRSDNWVDPITPVGWPQNGIPANYFEDSSDPNSCMGCHNARVFEQGTTTWFTGRFPDFDSSQLQYSFCDNVLNKAVAGGPGRSMPPVILSQPGAFSAALFQACFFNAGVGQVARATYNHTFDHNPSVLEANAFSEMLQAGDTFGEMQVAVARPYIRAVSPVFPAVEIDGNLDEIWTWYSRPQPIAVATGGATGITDSGGYWRAMYDETNLYVFVDVNDDVIDSSLSPSPWDDDGIEIFIDGGNEKGTSYDSNDFQYQIRRGDHTVYTGGGRANQDTTGVYPDFGTRPGGYTVEVRIPWDTLGVVPNTQIGFGVYINDDDNGGERDSQYSWRTSATNLWTDPSNLSTLEVPVAMVGRVFTEPLQIDGLDNEPEWVAHTEQSIYRQAEPIAWANNTGTWRSTWDEDNLYFFVHVNDNSLWGPGGGEVYQDDSVEIFIDGNNSHGTSYDGHDDFQFMFRYGQNNTTFYGPNSVGGSTNIQSMFQSVIGGYNLEVAIPWTTLKKSPSELGSLGLEIQINDDDDGSAREGKISWCSGNNDAYFNPSLFCGGQLVRGLSFDTPIPRITNNNVAFVASVEDVFPYDLIDSRLDVDGVEGDPLWNHVPVRSLGKVNRDSPTASASWRTAYNDEFLYFQFVVSDGAPVSNSGNWWENDSIEVYVDANLGRESSYDSFGFDVQYFFNPRFDGQVQLGPNSSGASTQGIEVESTWNSSGYVMEVAIPWTNLGIVPEQGAQFGLEVQLNDNDGWGRLGKLAWFANSFVGDAAWERPDVFGSIRLGGFPAAIEPKKNVLFSDTFPSDLNRWSESGAGNWDVSALHESAGYPGGHSAGPVGHADNCVTGCFLELAQAIDLTPFSTATLEFLYFTDWRLDPGEYLRLEAFNGSSWVLVEEWAGSGENIWRSRSVDLTPYLGVSDFSIRFVAQTNSFFEVVQIDDVMIFAE